MALIRTDRPIEETLYEKDNPAPQAQQLNPESMGNTELTNYLRGQGVKVGFSDMINKNKLLNHLNNLRVQQAQKGLFQNQLSAADQFMESMPSRIDQEVNAARTNITRQLVDQQRSMRGQAAGSGMLHSGRRQKAESQLAGQAGGELAGVRGDVVNKVVQQSEDMYGNVLGDRSRQTLNALKQQARLGEVSQNAELRRQEQFGQGLGLIGTGIGYGAGNQNWFGQPSSVPQYQHRPGTGMYITSG